MSEAALQLRRLVAALPKYQYRFGSEKELHDGIACVLDTCMIPYVREHVETDKDRFDFLCDDSIVVEAKIHRSFNEALRQCARYAKLDRVGAVVLGTSRHWGKVPPVKADAKLSGKPFRVVMLRGMSF